MVIVLLNSSVSVYSSVGSVLFLIVLRVIFILNPVCC